MQIQIFTVPILGGEEKIEEMNLFLRQNRVADIQKTFVSCESINYWSFCITYIVSQTKQQEDKKKTQKIDYRNELEEHIFARFCELRKLRKQIAEEEAIPPFAIFTDAELAEISKIENPTLASLKKIDGIGEKKAEKYGLKFCDLLSLLSQGN